MSARIYNYFLELNSAHTGLPKNDKIGKFDIFRENLERFIAGELPLRNQVDKQRGF